MNAYDVQEASGERIEVEADFYQRAGDELVFILSGEEVKRIIFADVAAITKVKL